MYGNPFSYMQVLFTTTLGTLDGKEAITKTTDAQGSATVALSSTVAGTAAITVTFIEDPIYGGWSDATTVVFKPATGTLVGQVVEEGRPDPPHPRWEITLTVKFSQTGSVVLTETVWTDASGVFTATVKPGVYNIWVKNRHTLAQRVDGVEVIGGQTTVVDFGILYEGDANDDNLIDIADFSIWKSLFGQFGTNADFNNDGIVDIVDFSMWKGSPCSGGDPLGWRRDQGEC